MITAIMNRLGKVQVAGKGLYGQSVTVLFCKMPDKENGIPAYGNDAHESA